MINHVFMLFLILKRLYLGSRLTQMDNFLWERHNAFQAFRLSQNIKKIKKKHKLLTLLQIQRFTKNWRKFFKQYGNIATRKKQQRSDHSCCAVIGALLPK